MKALRLKCFQETACYTKPFASKVAETYPLPPYSTVKGMIHAVMNATELIPFSLSVQGDFETRIVDYRKTYMVKKKGFAMPIIMDGLSSDVPVYDNKTMTSMPLYTHMLYNVNLIIHVRAEEDLLEKMLVAFQNNDQHLSLGRYEDLLRLDDVEIVELEECEGAELTNNIYIPVYYLNENISGIPYQLNWIYNIKDGLREWEKIKVKYVPKATDIYDDAMTQTLYIDQEENLVFWNV
ncbi:type I-B CRISPR-associated protein Cas5b [Scopulibacillus cellulosilyticus]|uniref:Type I-B CRISPR-associated protein Cas5b n=1 Tax=Scopulibacillus cellulosilyticus TaxID=2665665 RepID=A0ABW2PXD1_9BACL